MSYYTGIWIKIKDKKQPTFGRGVVLKLCPNKINTVCLGAVRQNGLALVDKSIFCYIIIIRKVAIIHPEQLERGRSYNSNLIFVYSAGVIVIQCNS